MQTKDDATLSLIERVNEFETVDNLINRLHARLCSWNDSPLYRSNGDTKLLSTLSESKIKSSFTTNFQSFCEQPRNLKAFTEWENMIEKAKKAIDANNLKKVVVARKSYPITLTTKNPKLPM